MRLFLDFDEVLADSIEAVLCILNEKYNKNIKFKELKKLAAANDVNRGGLYEESTKDTLQKVYVDEDSSYVKAMSDASSDMIQALKSIENGNIEPYKLSGKVKAKLERMQMIIDAGRDANDVETMANVNFSFREVTGIDYLKSFNIVTGKQIGRAHV